MRKKVQLFLVQAEILSNGALGIFYEGVMTTGYTTDATDEAVQANIVAVGYGSARVILTHDEYSGIRNCFL